jgi:type IV secretory pathway TrbD component
MMTLFVYTFNTTIVDNNINNFNNFNPLCVHRFDLKKNLLKTSFHTLNLLYGYILMLVAMTFNVWLFLALVIGFGVGYWFSQPFFESPPAKRSGGAKSYGTLDGM